MIPRGVPRVTRTDVVQVGTISNLDGIVESGN